MTAKEIQCLPKETAETLKGTLLLEKAQGCHNNYREHTHNVTKDPRMYIQIID